MLSNAATVLTLVIGVLCLCAALFVFDFLVQGFVIVPDVFRDNVHSPVGLTDYLKLAWLVSSITTVGRCARFRAGKPCRSPHGHLRRAPTQQGPQAAKLTILAR
jgi:hypothetical protein